MTKIKLGEFLIFSRDPTTVDPNKKYKQVTVKMNHKGVVLRKEIKGTEIKTKKQFIVKEGQFIMSRIDARNGAFGIVPIELKGAIVSGDFPTFIVDEDKINPHFFLFYSKTPAFLDACIRSSQGRTNRKRLKIEKFLDFELEIPDKKQQQAIVAKITKLENYFNSLQNEINDCQNNLKLLMETILVQGFPSND